MTVVGIRPWLPGPLGRLDWLTSPVPAERLAALRIGFGAVLLLDILATYLPFLGDYYGPGSLSAPDVFAARFESPYWHWSVLRWLPETSGPRIAATAWALSAIALLVGWHPRIAAGVAWALSWSFLNSNYYLHNGGDRLRHLVPFLLMLCPCGAVWSISTKLAQTERPIGVYPWPIRILVVQMAVMYFFTGVYKAFGPAWRDGSIMQFILTDAGWSRIHLQLPESFLWTASWVVLIWELGFPIWLLAPGTRAAALWLGVLFHVGTGLQLELGMFWLYALCLYLPFVPWEQLAWKRSFRRPAENESIE